MRWFRNVLLPVFMLVMVVAMPLAESAIANDLPPPQATPVSDDAPIHIQGELMPPTVHDVCGPDNDEIIPATSQPAGVSPEPEISDWENSQATLTYSPLEGYAFPDGMSTTIVVDELDADPCEEAGFSTLSSSMQQTEPIVRFNLPENYYGLPDAGINATVEYDFGDYEFEGDDDELMLKFRLHFSAGAAWTTTTYEMEAKGRSNVLQLNTQVPEWLAESCLYRRGDFSGRYELFIHNPTTGEVEFTQSTEFEVVPCSAKVTPEPPSLATNMCGLESEIDITVPAQDHVTIADSDWVNGTRTITYTPADYAFFPDGTQTKYTYTTKTCISSVEIDVEEGAFLNRQIDVPVNIDVTFTLEDGHPYDSVRLFPLQDKVVYKFDQVYIPIEPGVGGTFAITMPLTSYGPNPYPKHCRFINDGTIIRVGVLGRIGEVEDEPGTWDQTPSIPCNWATDVTPVADITQFEFCGPNNDALDVANQPEGVSHTVNDWTDGSTTVVFSPTDESYYFRHDPQTVFPFTDANDPCLTSISLDAEEGAFIDAIPVYNVPMTATVTLDETHEYESMQLLLYRDREAGLLPYPLGDFAVQPGDGGAYAFEVEYPGTPFGLENETCVDGAIELDITARPYHPGTSNPDYDAAISQTFSFPCSYLIQANPVIDITQVEVCGPNNDVFEIASQPTGVGYTIHDWSDGETAIEFYSEEGYYFWTTDQIAHDFRDKDTPCPTDAPVAPVQAEVCGPNNDELVIPPQPEGVTVDEDSGWDDGIRTITFAIDPAFITDGKTEFVFTDENIDCPIPTSTLTVQLLPTDGASLEDAPWKLFAPVAAQNIGTEPFAEGTVGTDNLIVVEDLIAGDYRLVVNADGYEQIDRVLHVAEGETTQEIQLDVVALQPVETPTPEPTVIATPTTEATPSPSPATPAPEPTDEAAPVSGLPSTGSGLGTGIGVFALAGLLGAMVLGAIGNRRRIHS